MSRGKKVAVIALTGGIGSGKSTVLEMLRSKGARTVDSDAIVHDLLKKDSSLKKKIRREFGDDVFDSHGQIIRRRLGEKVFRSVASRETLEKFIHPLVRKEIVRQVKKVKAGTVIVDIPLYFESGWHKRIRPVIVVNASQKRRFERLKKKGMKLSEILGRMQAQWPLEQKVRRADVVIENNGSLSRTKQQIDKLWGINGIRN
jgi:dephospho-CoA kinase